MRWTALAVLVVGVGACGDSKNKTVDAAVDGAPDAPPAPVTVTVHKDGGPQAGVRVFFQNADSSLVLSVSTDSSGVATTTMNAGGFVTVVDPAGPPVGGAHKVKTIAGVQPGDHLVVNATTNVQFAVHVTVPYVNNLSVQQYRVTSPCGSGTAPQPSGAPTNPVVDVILTDCAATTDFVVSVLDSNSGTMEFAYAANVAVTSQANIDLSASTYTNPNTRMYQLDNVPAGLAHPPILVDNPLSMGGPLMLTGGVATTGTTTSTASQRMPLISGLSYLTRVDLASSTYAPDYYKFLETAPYSDTYQTDLTAHLIGWVTAVPTYDATAHTLSWTEVAAGGTPDVSRVELGGARASLTWKWELVAAHTANTFAIPSLMDDAATYNLAAADVQSVDLTLAKIPGGYAGVRQNIFAGDVTNGAIAGQITLLEVASPM